MGVPQGSVISPTLFNYFVAGIASSTGRTRSFADDIHDSVKQKPTDGEHQLALERIAENLSSTAAELSAQTKELGMDLLLLLLFARWNCSWRMVGFVWLRLTRLRAHALGETR